LLQARLDGLPSEEREVLQRAAVVGRTFWDEAVADLHEGSEPVEGRPAADNGLRPLLDALARRDLIIRRDRSAFAGAVEYTFKHNLLREVTYETVLLRARRQYHARVARWLEVNAGGRLGEYLGLIAEHYTLAGANNRAAAYLERMGDGAQHSGAYRSARVAFERALALRQTDETTPEATLSTLRLKLGAVCWNLGDFPAAERALFYARDHARRAGDAGGQAIALYWLSRVAISRGDYAQARMLLAYGLPLARAADASTLAQVLYGVADVAWKLGDLDTVQTYVTESLTLARALDNTTLELMALNRLGTVAYIRGELELARSYYQTCLDLARATGSLEREATALMNLGALAHRLGDPAGGLNSYREALAHYRELGRSEQVVMALGNLAEAQVDRGELAEARRDLREGLALAWELGLLPRVTVMLFVYGRLLAAAGERERAAAVLRLIYRHPATENQTRPQVVAILNGLGCPLEGESADLAAAVVEVLEPGPAAGLEE
jgi:tetratricopeptide (TPR) repeat protein